MSLYNVVSYEIVVADPLLPGKQLGTDRRDACSEYRAVCGMTFQLSSPSRWASLTVICLAPFSVRYLYDA